MSTSTGDVSLTIMAPNESTPDDFSEKTTPEVKQDESSFSAPVTVPLGRKKQSIGKLVSFEWYWLCLVLLFFCGWYWLCLVSLFFVVGCSDALEHPAFPKGRNAISKRRCPGYLVPSSLVRCSSLFVIIDTFIFFPCLNKT